MSESSSERVVVPTGTLRRLRPQEVSPSRQNPRRLFDPEPLKVLKDNIRAHGVLVPITVYKIKGQERFQILDGERRHRCCLELQDEGIDITIPANVVDPPEPVAGLLYMFSIHNIREPWELMPVALSLRLIMEKLGDDDTKRLALFTGLNEKQIERCKILLEIPKRFQDLSLNPDPKKRIPANLWTEGYPVFDVIKEWLPAVYKSLGREGICDIWVKKYETGALKSVLHFRRILQAAEQAGEDDREVEFRGRLQTYLEQIPRETRESFDTFFIESKKIETAKATCDDFMSKIRRAKIEHLDDKEAVVQSLEKVRSFVDELIFKLKGEDPRSLL